MNISEKAEEILTQREKEYGSVDDNFKTIASYWAAYLGVPLSPSDVANLMILLKISRTKKFHYDSYVDIVGYSRCAEKLNK